MQKRRRLVAVAIACMLILSGFAVACTPQSPSAGATGAGSLANQSATPNQEASPPPTQTGQPRAANASQAIQELGLTRFQHIYAAEVGEPDGSDVVLLGPGDESAFMTALHTLLASSDIKALGPEPTVTITRVPHSYADFTAVSNAYTAAIPRLISAGFLPNTTSPDYLTGTADVTFSAAPKGMTTAQATAYLQKMVSPMIRVTSVNAEKVKEYNNRGHDAVPFKGSDLIRNSGSTGFCTSGFSVLGALNLPRGSTSAHCNGNDHGNNNFTNRGWWVDGFYPAPEDPTQNSDTPIPFGHTTNFVIGGDADIQFLNNSSNGYDPIVWVGKGMSQPIEKPVGHAYPSYPKIGTYLTTDGAFSREHRWVREDDFGSMVCYYNVVYAENICGMLELEAQSSQSGPGGWPGPTAQPGDSGGPVFCYACLPGGKVEPAGLIEAGNDHHTSGYIYVTFIGNDLAAIGGGSQIYQAP